MVSRKTWFAFIVVQVAGLICVLISALASAYENFNVPPAIYAAAMFLLLPGDFIGGLLIEKVLLSVGLTWGDWLTPKQIGVVEVLLGVVINLCVWIVCARLIRTTKRFATRQRHGI